MEHDRIQWTYNTITKKIPGKQYIIRSEEAMRVNYFYKRTSDSIKSYVEHLPPSLGKYHYACKHAKMATQASS